MALAKSPHPLSTSPKDPKPSTAQEKEDHNVTHLPHRVWCRVCQEARGKAYSHMEAKQGREFEDKPTVGPDYKSFGQYLSIDDKLTATVLRDKSTRTTVAHSCGHTGQVTSVSSTTDRRTTIGGQRVQVVELNCEHAPLLLNRFQLGKDDKSSYRRLWGNDSSKTIVECGEQVFAKPRRAKRRPV